MQPETIDCLKNLQVRLERLRDEIEEIEDHVDVEALDASGLDSDPYTAAVEILRGLREYLTDASRLIDEDVLPEGA